MPDKRAIAGRVTHYPYLRARDWHKVLLPLKSPVRRTEDLLTQYLGKPVILLNSGRTGIYLALAAGGMRRVDEILVPRYLSQCVLNTINRTAFPTTQESERTKAILLLHQFGYPQRVEEVTQYAQDKGWLIIEDCAHSFASRYRGKYIGSFGDAAIYSLPKVFPTVFGGCLLTDDRKILGFARAYMLKKRGCWRAILSNISMAAMFMSSGVWPEKTRNRLKPLVEICYSQFTEFPGPNRFMSRLALRATLGLEENARRRKENLGIFKEYFLNNGYREELEEGCEVVPFLIPYFDDDEEKLVRIASSLKEINVETEVLHFDIRRNMLEPEYRKCVPVPTHHGVSFEMMHRICQHIIKGGKQ